MVAKRQSINSKLADRCKTFTFVVYAKSHAKAVNNTVTRKFIQSKDVIWLGKLSDEYMKKLTEKSDSSSSDDSQEGEEEIQDEEVRTKKSSEGSDIKDKELRCALF